MHKNVLRDVFSTNDLRPIYRATLKDFSYFCKEIKSLTTKKSPEFPNSEIFNQKNQNQLISELELCLELLLILTNLINIDQNMFTEIVKEFNKNAIIKHLATMPTNNKCTNQIEQISYLKALIVVKTLRIDKLMSAESQANRLSQEDKTQFVNNETKNLMNDLILSFGSNQRASPVILAWTTLLYNLSIDQNISKSIISDFFYK